MNFKEFQQCMSNNFECPYCRNYIYDNANKLFNSFLGNSHCEKAFAYNIFTDCIQIFSQGSQMTICQDDILYFNGNLIGTINNFSSIEALFIKLDLLKFYE
jgi:hypothetical protein